ncbi:MAG: GTPase Era [Acidimicrobiia bacterium]
MPDHDTTRTSGDAGEDAVGDTAAAKKAADGRLTAMLAAAGIDKDPSGPLPPGHRSGFVTMVGRPNVGKSALVNSMVGEKVSIVTNKPHTTRFALRGVLTRPDAQIVFVDTPGIHKPRNAAGERFNANAYDGLSDVDIAVVVFDGSKPIGRGDRFVAERAGRNAVYVLNKIDKMAYAQLPLQLQVLSDLGGEFGAEAYFPMSARTGEGVDAFIEHLVNRLPEGPQYYPPDMATDLDDPVWVAELVREQLMERFREEMPHSMATRVTEWDWPKVRCEIVVERESQKGMVIGKRGQVLKEVGTAVRHQVPGMHIELFVRVASDWQRRPELFDRLGL